MRRIALALGVLCCFPVSAMAFSYSTTDSGHVIKWYKDTPTFDLQIDQDGPSRRRSGTTQTQINEAINTAIASWNDVTCSDVNLVWASSTLETDNVVSGTETTDALDEINRVVWIENDTDYPFGENVLGVTSAIFYQDGTIIEADIALNGADDSWAVYSDGESYGAYVDVESVVVHELGHLLGLAHVLKDYSTSDPPTMAPTVDTQLRTRDPNTDDQNAICLLYPHSTYSCESDSDCPKFIVSDGTSDGGTESYASTVSECTGDGTCSNVKIVECGAGSLGERCCTDNCIGSLFCLALGSSDITDMAYCASSCSLSSSDCADGFTCVALTSGGSSGACITNAVTGCSCDTNTGCTSGCACDTDCGASGSDGSSDDGGCAAVTGVWAALACAALMMRRVRLL